MLSSSNWTDACLNALNRSEEQKLAALYVSGGITIAAYFLCGAVAAVMLILWLRVGSDEKEHLWPIYGWLSGLICIGCCAGILRVAVLMLLLGKLYQGQVDNNWTGWAACGTICRVAVHASHVSMFAIDRMKEFAFPPSRPKINIGVVSRWVVRSVVAGVLLELGASVADAVSLFDSGGPDKTALLVANSTEITLLSLIIVSFILICLACLFRIRSTLGLMNETSANEAVSKTGRELGLKIVVMTIAIFFSFCLQLAFALLELIGGQDTCDSSVDSCDSCSAGLHNSVSMWLLHTPEFYFVVLLSIALSMLVLLWGMTSDRLLQAIYKRSEPACDNRHHNMKVLLLP